MYWKIASLLIFAIFCGWSFIEMKLKTKKEDEIEQAFWEREAKANTIRRKSIDHLDYITIPDDLPVDILSDDEEIQNILKVIRELKNDRILNLTGYTNTDLKLEYGAPNLTELSRYDQNFTALVTSLQKWADILIKNGYQSEANKLLEFLIFSGGDIKKAYITLGKYYKENCPEKLSVLLESAEALRSLNKPYIVEAVKDLMK